MLDHPFGPDGKKRLLRSLSPKQATDALRALFPELGIAGVEAGVLAPFDPWGADWTITKGDLSGKWIAEAQAELVRLGVWEEAMSPAVADDERVSAGAVILEEHGDPSRAAVLLAKHYYLYAMFPWFWMAYEAARKWDVHKLHGMAIDIACFDERAPRSMEACFADCLAKCRTGAGRQRLWNKLGVLYGYRSAFADARQALAEAWKLLGEVEDGPERVCREAEWYNAEAFLGFRSGDLKVAEAALVRAEWRLAQCPADYPRVESIRRILVSNRRRLEKLGAAAP